MAKRRSLKEISAAAIQEHSLRWAEYFDVIGFVAAEIAVVEVESILFWKVAHALTTRLDLPDVVIYCVDENGEKIVQVAASHGAKDKDGSVNGHLTLDVGQGITGRVAETGKPALINDMREEPEHIREIGSGRSELAVPVFVDGYVAAVIDCEGPVYNFFETRHLKTLENVALIMGEKLKQIRSMSARQFKHRTAVAEIAGLRRTVKQLEEGEAGLRAAAEDAALVARRLKKKSLDARGEDLVDSVIQDGFSTRAVDFINEVTDRLEKGRAVQFHPVHLGNLVSGKIRFFEEIAAEIGVALKDVSDDGKRFAGEVLSDASELDRFIICALRTYALAGCVRTSGIRAVGLGRSQVILELSTEDGSPPDGGWIEFSRDRLMSFANGIKVVEQLEAAAHRANGVLLLRSNEDRGLLITLTLARAGSV